MVTSVSYDKAYIANALPHSTTPLSGFFHLYPLRNFLRLYYLFQFTFLAGRYHDTCNHEPPQDLEPAVV